MLCVASLQICENFHTSSMEPETRLTLKLRAVGFLLVLCMIWLVLIPDSGSQGMHLYHVPFELYGGAYRGEVSTMQLQSSQFTQTDQFYDPTQPGGFSVEYPLERTDGLSLNLFDLTFTVEVHVVKLGSSVWPSGAMVAL
jgi:hypothetical protein